MWLDVPVTLLHPHQELKAILPDTSYGAKDDLAAGLAAVRSREEVQRLVEQAQYEDEVGVT